MGPDPRTPAQKDAEGRAALEQILTREGLFGWGPVLRRIADAIGPAVAERTATGRVSPETAARVGHAVEQALVLPDAIPPFLTELVAKVGAPEPAPAPDWVANPGFATPDPTPTKG